MQQNEDCLFPSHPTFAFLVAQDDDIVASGFASNSCHLNTTTSAAVLGAQALGPLPLHPTTFFLPYPTLSLLTSLHKYTLLPTSFHFTTSLSTFLTISPSPSFSLHHLPVHLPPKPKPGHRHPDPRNFPHSWPGPPCKNHILNEPCVAAQTQTQTQTQTSLPMLTPKCSAFEAWKTDGYPPIPCKWTDNFCLPVPDSAIPPPGMIGMLSLKQRRASSLFLQVLFKHCFSGDYSCGFHPHAPDVTSCKCSYPLDSQDQSAELPAVPTLVMDPVATSVLSPLMPTLVGEDVEDQSA